uniref:Uncharacterized protein n=1 Tax=Junco hyemalis TaxID=40217 RepID=A0A8C5NPK2_JUNHY
MQKQTQSSIKKLQILKRKKLSTSDLGKSVGGRKGKVKRYFPLAQLPEMMWLLFEAVIQYVLVTLLLQIRIVLSVSLLRRVIALHLEAQEEKSCLNKPPHLRQKKMSLKGQRAIKCIGNLFSVTPQFIHLSCRGDYLVWVFF